MVHYLLKGDPMMEGPGSPRPSEIMEGQFWCDMQNV